MSDVDAGEAVRFLKDVFAGATEGFIGLWVKSKDNTVKDSYWFPADNPEAAAETIDRMAVHHETYFHLALHRNPTPTKQRGTIAGSIATPGLWLDLDWRDDGAHKKQNLPPDLESCLSLINGLPEPSIVINSGHGLQVYWLYREPWYFDSDIERGEAGILGARLTARVRECARKHGWDVDSAHDLGHVFRMPGTINHKRGAVPVIVYQQSDARYNPSDFDEILPPADTRSSQNGHAPDIGPVAVNIEANPPFDKHDAALANLPKYRGSWERTRKDLQDQSNSGWDMSLASMTVPLGWSDQEITDLLIASRRKHHADTALSRSYLEHTLRRARLGNEHAHAIAELESSGPPDDANDALKLLSGVFQVPISGAVRRGHEGAIYGLVVDGVEVIIGNSVEMQRQAAVRGAIYDATGHMFPPMKPAPWFKACDAIAKVAVVVDHPDGSPITEIEGYVADYVRDQYAGRSEDPWQSALPNGDPFWRDGRVWVHVDALRSHLATNRGLRGITNADLRVLLGRAGFVGRQITGRPDAGSPPVGRYYWCGPAGFPLEESN